MMMRMAGERTARGSSSSHPGSGANAPALSVGISLPSVVKAALVLLAIVAGIAFIAQLRGFLVLIVLALFLAAILAPAINVLQRAGLPRSMGILLAYGVSLGVIVLFLVSFIPMLVIELLQIVDRVNVFLSNLPHETETVPVLLPGIGWQLPGFMEMVLRELFLHQMPAALEQMNQDLFLFTREALRIVSGIAGSTARFVLDTVITLVLTYFLLMEKERNFGWALGFFPARSRPYIRLKTVQIRQKIAQWTWGRILLSLFISVCTWIVLLVFGVPYALTLAVLAGIMDIIPYMGMVISMIPIFLITSASVGVEQGVLVLVAFTIIQLLQNVVVIPVVMQRTVSLSASAVIIAMVVGASFPTVMHPMIGILLSIPLLAVIGIFFDELRSKVDAQENATGDKNR